MTRLPVFVALLCRWMHQEQNDVIALDPAAQRRGEPLERNHGRYVSDVDLVLGQNEVDGYGGLAGVVRLTGPTGAAVVVDTSRCLHSGSRVKPGCFRLCLYIQYCTSAAKANSFDARRFRNDPVRWLALKRHAAPGQTRRAG